MTRTKDQVDSALRDAIGRRDAASVQAFLSEGADLSTSDHEGRTPLMLAAKIGAPEIVELLLRAGSDPTAKDKLGYTAEMLANWYGEYRMGAYTAESTKIVEMLRRAQGLNI
jgi:ankyrin repeat protein